MADNFVKGTKDAPKSVAKSTPKKNTRNFELNKTWGSIRDYLTSVYNELKKVHWPDRRTLVAYTIVVLIAVAIISGLLYLYDVILGLLLGLIL
ncbi:MAG: preprotein translocase subunit SecE [Syntrophomonadaceae bacterium]|nr:preprotein translocase subunit SecE [Syntrophomonadaceae bacterium]